MADDDLATLVLLLARLERLNDALVSEVCRAHGVTAAELRVLAVLHQDRAGTMRPTELGQLILQTSGGLTATLRRLERLGRIERVAGTDDARSKPVRLTSEGRRFYEATVGGLLERYRRAFPPGDLATALAGVRQVTEALERDAGARSSAGWRYPDDRDVTS